jgi:ribosome-associated translation inhibitor RaiA
MLTEGIHDHVHRRLSFALSNRFQQIKRVIVRLSDINGPRGGADKRCHIQITLPHQSDVVIEDVQADLYRAVDRAADRANRTLGRRLSRLRRRSRNGRGDKHLAPQDDTTAITMHEGEQQ